MDEDGLGRPPRRYPSIRLEWVAVAALLLILGISWALRERSGSRATSPVPPQTLTVEEHPLVERGVDTPTHFEFHSRVPEAIRDLRRAWRELPSPWGAGDLAAANQGLMPFGFKLEKGGVPGRLTYNLYRGTALSLTDITWFGPLAVSEGKDQFALVVELSNGSTFLITPGGISVWDPRVHLQQPPVFAGQDLVSVNGVGVGMREFWVMVGDQVVFSSPMSPWTARLPLRRLDAWEGQWLVEVGGEVIIGGKSLNQQLAYEEIFDWQRVNGKAFFFFRQGSKYGLSYDGRPLTQTYDEIVHYQCCEPGMFNPLGNGSMVWFYARRGELWYYVEVGVYSQGQ
jgi:hypothetical protein